MSFLLGGLGGAWYGMELFEYARLRFIDGYAVEHVPAGCAQAACEYKTTFGPLLFCSLALFRFSHSKSFLQKRGVDY